MDSRIQKLFFEYSCIKIRRYMTSEALEGSDRRSQTCANYYSFGYYA
jgi:hypothetical protein